MEFVKIPGGCYRMGSPEGEAERDDEKAHRVCVDAFGLGTKEVTNAQYRLYKCGHDSGDYDGHDLNGDDQPVVEVSWEDATAYAEWLSRRTGKKYRLPTEAEWEYAARGGTTTASYWGDDPDRACSYGNIHDRSSKRAFDNFTWEAHNCDDGYAVTAPVGRYRPNDYGLYDMLGNVWEWTCSEYASSYDGKETKCLSKNRAGGRSLARRGGSWNYGPRLARAAYRSWDMPGNRNYFLGFRLAQDLSL